MKKRLSNLLIFFIISQLILISSTYVSAAEVSIIVNIQNESILSLSKADIKAIYLGKTHFWGKEEILPVLMSEGDPLTKAFLSNILEMDINKFKIYWLKKLFAEGVAVPPMLNSVDEIINHVKTKKGGIGFTPKELGRDKGVKTVANIDVGM